MAKKLSKPVIVVIVEKDYFKRRVVTGNDKLGEFMYETYIALLTAIGKEVEHSNRVDVGLFTYVESDAKHRYFEVEEKIAVVFQNNFRFKMSEALDKFAQDSRKEGTNLLMQLNSGELSLNDFNETINNS